MGIKGLLTFATSPFVNASSHVRFSGDADEYRGAHHGRNPLLVCDGNSLLRKLYPTSIPSIYGGQWIEYKASVAEFVNKFWHLGINLLVVFDGKVDEGKKDVWFQRRREDHEKNCKIFDSIRESGREPDRRKFFTLPATMQYSTILILKSLGVEVICSFTDADTEVAFQARERNAFGILSNDSDILIYDCQCPVFTIFDLDVFEMKTAKIIPNRLCYHLNLEQSDMPLLACLVGNDHIPHLMLERFHHRIGTPIQGLPKQQSIIVKAAEYIVWSKNMNSNLLDVAYDVLPEKSREYLKFFIRSFAQYVLPYGGISPWLKNCPPLGEGNWADAPVPCSWRIAVFPSGLPQILQRMASSCGEELLKAIVDRHADGDTPPAIYTILFYHHFRCSSSLEDKKQTDIPSIKQLFGDIRMQIYALLLSPKDMRSNKVSVTEWHGDKSIDMGVSEHCVPVSFFKSCGVPISPNLRDLHTPLKRQCSELNMRMFFSTCCGDDLIPIMHKYLSIPPHLTVLCLLLRYLFFTIRPQFLKTQEVDAFIAQAISHVREDIKELKNIRVLPRPRPVNLASIFVRGIGIFGVANAACGCPLPQGAFSPVYIFNGVLFMKKYMQTLHNIGLEILLDKKTDARSLFLHLKHLITTRT